MNMMLMQRGILAGCIAFMSAVPLAASAAVVFADSVASVSPGGSGSGVYQVVSSACAGTPGPGVFAASAVTALDGCGWALGGASTGPLGSIVMHFTTGSVVDGAGNDIEIYDTFGINESLTVEASANGTTFVGIGSAPSPFFVSSCSFSAPCVAGFNLAGSGLTSASYFRLTAVSGGCVFNYPECYDLDALGALNFNQGAVPEPSSVALVLLAVLAATGARRRRARLVAMG